MYALLTGLYRDYSTVYTRCVLLLGPSQSGKTVLLTRIKAFSRSQSSHARKEEGKKGQTVQDVRAEDVYEVLKRDQEPSGGVKVRGIAATVGQNGESPSLGFPSVSNPSSLLGNTRSHYLTPRATQCTPSSPPLHAYNYASGTLAGQSL